MFRKLLLALAFLLLPIAGAHALGLGGVSLQSRLNQPLDAEIELRSVEPGDLEKLQVSLASREEFERSGLDRPFILASLVFETVQRGDKNIIKVTTKDAFREPFVSFLLKVEWPNGRLLREYTLLLDPPVLTREAAPAVQAPAAGSAPQMAPVQPALPTSPTQATRTPRAAPAPRVLPVGGDEYRVRRGDSLLKITRDTFSDPGVSSQQAMLAFLRANREAFINDNINLLKEGYVLRVPTAQEALSVDQAEAVAEVRRQVAEWRTYRQQRMADSGGAASSVAAAPQPRLEVVAPKSEAGAAASGAGGTEDVGADTQSLQRDLALATEAAEARRLENEELREQVTGLEEKLAEMQRMVTLKVDELAALQARLQEAGAEERTATMAPPEATPTPVTEEPPKAEMAGDEVAPKAETPAPSDAAPAVVTPGPEPAMAEMKEEQPAPPASEPAPQASIQPPKVEPAAEPGPMGFIDDLLGNLMADPVMLGGVGGGVLLLILLLFYAVGRRKAAAAEASGFSADLMEAEDEVESSSMDEELLDAAAAMEIADFDEPEVDAAAEEEKSGVDQVIAEADVYLAYGRYQQAEELIKGALDENPGRLDLKSKLLEVYFATRNRSEFEAVVGDVHSELQAEGGSEWDKLQLMGQDLCPGNPLFGDRGEGAGDAESTLPPGALDTGIDFDPFGEAASEAAGDETMDEDLGLELDGVAAPETGTEEEIAAATAEEEGADFRFDLDEEPAKDEAELPAVEGEPSQALEFDSTLLGVDQDDEELDLSFDLEEAADEGAESGLDLDFGGAESEGVDTDLSSTDFDLELNTIQTDTTKLGTEEAAEAPEAEEETAAVAPEDASMAEDRDFSIEWDITGMGLEAPEDESEADTSGAHLTEHPDDLESTAILDFTAVPLDDDDDGEADMVATKLDLAKAYIDMGDADGAKNILDEVAKEGNDAQRKEAEELIANLS